MTQTTFSRSLSEKLIEKNIHWLTSDFFFSDGEIHSEFESVFDNPETPVLSLETALSKDFLSQLTTAVLSASTDIAWSFTAKGYEGAEEMLIKLMEKK